MLKPVELAKAYRLINHGPTVMVSAKADDVENVMSASWACALEFQPAKVTVVIDKAAYTRQLIEKSGYFALQVPVAEQAELVLAMGQSRKENVHKLKDNGVELFYVDDFPIPLVPNCAAYLLCKLIPEPHNQQTHDLFIGEVIYALADDRLFNHGHWDFDNAPDHLKTLHYVAGGQFYLTGKGLKFESDI